MFTIEMQNNEILTLSISICSPPLNVKVFKKRSRMQVAAGLRLSKTRARKTI